MAFRADELIQILSDDEIERAERYYFRRDQKRFIIRRGLLRSILSNYLNAEPSKLYFYYGKNGKPLLLNNSGQELIKFSVSCSGGAALYGFTKNSEIGVDIERIRDMPDIIKIVLQFFSDNEKAVFFALSPQKRREAFFTFWTRKEAFVKAIGRGLYYDLVNLDVSSSSNEIGKIRTKLDDSDDISKWSIRDLEFKSGYKAALAYKDCDRVIVNWLWDKQGGIT